MVLMRLTIDRVKNDTELRKLVEQEMQELTPSTTSDNFAKFYKKFFIMAKQAPESKSIPLDQAQVYWSMVLNPISYLTKKPSEEDEGNSAFPHAAQFVEFLGQQTQVKVINRDQWESFIRFNRDVGSDLTGYSEDSACKCNTQRRRESSRLICSRAFTLRRVCYLASRQKQNRNTLCHKSRIIGVISFLSWRSSS